MSSRSLILIGFMASGKSHIGHLLADHSKRDFIDLDARLEEHFGTSIAHVFATRGEAYFREHETKVLLDTLQQTAQRPAVISTGGGIVTNKANRVALKTASECGMRVIYLRATPPTLTERIRHEPGTRPLIDGEKELTLAETTERVKVLLAARRLFYEECADHIIDTDTLSPDEIVQQILEQCEK